MKVKTLQQLKIYLKNWLVTTTLTRTTFSSNLSLSYLNITSEYITNLFYLQRK